MYSGFEKYQVENRKYKIALSQKIFMSSVSSIVGIKSPKIVTRLQVVFGCGIPTPDVIPEVGGVVWILRVGFARSATGRNIARVITTRRSHIENCSRATNRLVKNRAMALRKMSTSIGLTRMLVNSIAPTDTKTCNTTIVRLIIHSRKANLTDIKCNF